MTRSSAHAGRRSENGAHRLSDGSGNYVMLDLGDGRYAVYEHLRPGGRYPDVDALGTQPWDREPAMQRRGERPADNAVIAFPG